MEGSDSVVLSHPSWCSCGAIVICTRAVSVMQYNVSFVHLLVFESYTILAISMLHLTKVATSILPRRLCEYLIGNCGRDQLSLCLAGKKLADSIVFCERE